MTDGELQRIEDRIQVQIDRRFNEFGWRFTRLAEDIAEMKKDIIAIDTKVDNNTLKLQEKQEEQRTWINRQIIISILSFIFGSGSVALVQIIMSMLGHR